MKTIAELVKDEALVADGYERVKGDLDAVPVDQLLQVNLDIQQATRTILGALPELQELRSRIVAELTSFDIASFDKLEDYVQALRYAQTGYWIATQPPDDLEQMLRTVRSSRSDSWRTRARSRSTGCSAPRSWTSSRAAMG